MEKRGQFFLIAALVIVGIVVGLSVVYNYAKFPEEDSTVYDLSKEIKFEGAQVMTSGVLENVPPEQILDRLKVIMGYYVNASTNTDFLVIYGNETDLTIIFYNNTDQGLICVDLGGGSCEGNDHIAATQEQHKSRGETSNIITLTLPDGAVYTFELKEGQVFYAILQKESFDDVFVSGTEPSEGTPAGGTIGGEGNLCPNGHIRNDDGTCGVEINNVIEDGDIVSALTSASGYVRNNTNQEIKVGNIVGKTYKGYIEWNLSDIPENVSIENIKIRIYANGVVEGSKIKIYSLKNARPLTSPNNQLFNEMKESNKYGSYSINSGKNEVDITKKESTEDINNLLSLNEKWFAIGLGVDEESNIININSEESNNPPVLIFTYTF
ncbi:hypothetical protein HYV50_05570 [Candidatus Pacearchaeota archaeon]|nr:hypothetical protein [Candidatus Pacearchaeota archaeon]